MCDCVLVSRDHRVAVARSANRGWALLFVMLLAALFIIAASTALPKAAFEIRRQREADLMNRGLDYRRAIQLYFRKFRKYPARIEDLESTNQLRFLRRRWKDPMTGSDEWRLLHMNPAGMVIDSAVAGAIGATGGTGAQQQNIGLTPSLAVTASIATTTGTTTSGFTNQATVIGAGIAGVASKSEKDSIMVYNTRQKYNEWEFVYDYRKDPLMQAAIQQQQLQQGQQPARPGGPAPPPGGLSPTGPAIGTPIIPFPPNPTIPRP